MQTENDLFLPADLFRVGNVQTPRLDHIRERDIEIISFEGKLFVLPNTGGISAFNKINTKLRGTWWKCPAGTIYPQELKIICDRQFGELKHYSVQPAFPMPLELYRAKLLEFAECFQKIIFS